MKSMHTKAAAVLLLVLVAGILVFALTQLMQPDPVASQPKAHLPMIPTGSPELIPVLNKIDPIDGLQPLTANHTKSDDTFRVSGQADTREKVSEYLGALERVGLRNYVLEVKDAQGSETGHSFLITGKLTLE